jgi:hypothetical protein
MTTPPKPIAGREAPCPQCRMTGEHKLQCGLRFSPKPATEAEREWTPEERDAYYSRLPGDARLVAGLDPAAGEVEPVAQTHQRAEVPAVTPKDAVTLIAQQAKRLLVERFHSRIAERYREGEMVCIDDIGALLDELLGES